MEKRKILPLLGIEILAVQPIAQIFTVITLSLTGFPLVCPSQVY
jgi:hypothetical protein